MGECNHLNAAHGPCPLLGAKVIFAGTTNRKKKTDLDLYLASIYTYIYPILDQFCYDLKYCMDAETLVHQTPFLSRAPAAARPLGQQPMITSSNQHDTVSRNRPTCDFQLTHCSPDWCPTWPSTPLSDSRIGSPSRASHTRLSPPPSTGTESPGGSRRPPPPAPHRKEVKTTDGVRLHGWPTTRRRPTPLKQNSSMICPQRGVIHSPPNLAPFPLTFPQPCLSGHAPHAGYDRVQLAFLYSLQRALFLPTLSTSSRRIFVTGSACPEGKLFSSSGFAPAVTSFSEGML